MKIGCVVRNHQTTYGQGNDKSVLVIGRLSFNEASNILLAQSIRVIRSRIPLLMINNIP